MDSHHSHNHEIGRKRKINFHDQSPRPTKYTSTEEDDADLLTLGLSTFPTAAVHLPPPSYPSPSAAAVHLPPSYPAPSVVSVRPRRKPPSEGKSETITPLFPWSTGHRATVHSLEYLQSRGITTIGGEVYCKRCERRYSMDLDLVPRFEELKAYIAASKDNMHHRAPAVWLSPNLPRCRFCDQDNSIRPVIAEKKRSINWLFLLLGQMLGCCTLDQLKYFCKHTKNHRTGAKNRVLYLAYLALCKQLQPIELFNI